MKKVWRSKIKESNESYEKCVLIQRVGAPRDPARACVTFFRCFQRGYEDSCSNGITTTRRVESFRSTRTNKPFIFGSWSLSSRRQEFPFVCVCGPSSSIRFNRSRSSILRRHQSFPLPSHLSSLLLESFGSLPPDIHIRHGPIQNLVMLRNKGVISPFEY